MNLSITVKESNPKSIVYLSGEIDAYTAPNLKAKLIPLSEKESSILEVDMKQVRYMDSTGLGVFISILKSTKEHGSQLKLINLQERVYRLFTITGLIDIMDITSTIRGANG